MSYEIIPKRGYVELWVDGEFKGSFDTEEEAWQKYQLRENLNEGKLK